MRAATTRLEGVMVIEAERVADDRGFFARTWDTSFNTTPIPSPEYGAVSFNHRARTLRGLHYQSAPSVETKIVRCTAGAVFDVVVDLREGSPTWREWISVELSGDNHRTIIVPPMCAHGFLTLKPDSEVEYLISGRYEPDAAHGIRWNDPAVNIGWPQSPVVISPRDESYELLPS